MTELDGDARQNVVVRVAQPEEADAVVDVLLEAAAWLEQRRIPLWNASELERGAIAADVHAGFYFVAVDGGMPVGTVRLTLDDPLFWPDADLGEAVYLHRLAVRRSHAGGSVSSMLIAWAAAHCAALGRSRVRLDCDAARPRLRAVYERLGFVFHSYRTVGPYHVARYELAV